MVGASRSRPAEEHLFSRRASTPGSSGVLARWRASKESEATCDRLCRADDAVSRSIRLQIFAFHETSREAACLVKRDRIAWMSEQTKHIAGQLVLGRTTPLWQLIRRNGWVLTWLLLSKMKKAR